MDIQTFKYRSTNVPALRILLVVLALVSLSCNILANESKEEDTSAKDTEIALGIQQTLDARQAETPPTEAPTLPPPPTEPPAVQPTIAPLPTKAPAGLVDRSASQPGELYFSETFETMDGWSAFPMQGDPDGWGYQIFDNRLRAEIQTQDTWAYYLFEGGGDFQDVRIDITVENRASNTNFVGMICRYSDQGWYEANILNTGEYAIFYGGPSGLEATMHTGGSFQIKTGRSINSYALICQGETLTLLINGAEEFSMPLRAGSYGYLDGGIVGFSVSTTNVIPVVVDFLQYDLSVP